MKPTHLAIVFDKSEHTFRNELFAGYKANRSDPPSELVPQFSLTREAVRAFGLIPIEQAGLEADDLIATYACRASEAGADVLIVSADKDLMQLVGDRVTFYDPESGLKGKPGYRPERRLDRDGVIEKFGAPPEQVPDIQALVGDSTDNVPGVPGIGPKAAATLIGELGSLEAILAYKDRPEELDAVLSARLAELQAELDDARRRAGQDQFRRPDRRGPDGQIRRRRSAARQEGQADRRCRDAGAARLRPRLLPGARAGPKPFARDRRHRPQGARQRRPGALVEAARHPRMQCGARGADRGAGARRRRRQAPGRLLQGARTEPARQARGRGLRRRGRRRRRRPAPRRDGRRREVASAGRRVSAQSRNGRDRRRRALSPTDLGLARDRLLLAQVGNTDCVGDSER